MAIESITKTLGSGSGIDLSGLVGSLVEAQFATKSAQLTSRNETLTAQISSLAQIKSGITGFASALKSLVGGGTLGTLPTSSAPSVLGVSRIPGSGLASVSAKVTVQQLAAAQAATSTNAIARNTQFKTGTLQLNIGTEGPPFAATQTAAIEITSANATIDGIAAAINAAKDANGVSLGLTATVITDGAGVRLSVKSQTGAAKAFEINATDASEASGESLSAVAVNRGTGNGMTIGATATDAKVVVDGATFTRSSNTVGDLIPGITLDLKATSAEPILISATKQTGNLSQAINDFVATYNELLGVLKEQTDPLNGPLRTDSFVSSMKRSLAQLTTTQLVAANGTAPTTLADLGIATARDGTLSIDTTRLNKALADNPDAVEKMFSSASGTSTVQNGLSAALSAVAARATDRTFGLEAISLRYTEARSRIADQQAELAEKREAATERMTRQFASMDARVAAYKSTQTFLENQVKAWNREA
jgi:flagellar hook-associated protein 2